MKTFARIVPFNLPVLRRPPMRAPMRALSWALAAAVSAGVCGAAWAGSCEEAARPLIEALKARDLEATRRHYEALEAAFDCPDAYRATAARAVAKLHGNVVLERMEDGASLESQREELERGLAYVKNKGAWLPLALLGDAVHATNDYHRAAELYQAALVAINNEVDTPTPPPWPEIERIHRRAWQSRMLAKQFVATPVDRSGEPDGLGAPTIRGHAIKRIPIPITFEFDSVEFDEQGERYAAELAKHLIRQRPERIVITAHTDPRGSASYNLDLSRRRGLTVVEFLQAKLAERNVSIAIEMVPKGKSEPIPHDLKEYDEEERMRMHRRVELVR